MMTAAIATDEKRVAPAMIALVLGAVAMGASVMFSTLMRTGQFEVGP